MQWTEGQYNTHRLNLRCVSATVAWRTTKQDKDYVIHVCGTKIGSCNNLSEAKAIAEEALKKEIVLMEAQISDAKRYLHRSQTSSS